MTTDAAGLVPEWTQGDRLRKARSLTGLTVRDFAEEIGVSHGTVTSAETDARAVRTITLRAWALRTGVSINWLETGAEPSGPDGPEGVRSDVVRQQGLEPRTRWLRVSSHRRASLRLVGAAA